MPRASLIPWCGNGKGERLISALGFRTFAASRRPEHGMNESLPAARELGKGIAGVQLAFFPALNPPRLSP